MPLEIVETDDGSITCFDKATGELYHNKAGAYAEALANFIRPSGLIEKSLTAESLSILDVPFGLGYNTFVFLQSLIGLPANHSLKNVSIIGLELDPEVMQVLPRVIADERFSALRSSVSNIQDMLHKLARFEESECAVGGVSVLIHCKRGDIRKEVPKLANTDFKFDAILHDPFSPNKMPELWTLDLFRLYKQLLREDGRLLTYSSAVAVRGACREAGLFLYRTAALGGKSGGTMASVCELTCFPRDIFSLTDAEMQKLMTCSAVPYRDPAFENIRSEILKRRQLDQRAWTEPVVGRGP
jgi:tRNA U34 5-methylaminomethyl-2-thiouridine-forming methyltransferase MnmC